MDHDIPVQNYKYKEWETEQEEFMAYNIKLVLLASQDLVGLIFSQHQWPSHLVIKLSVNTLTVSTPPATTSNSTPTTSSGVSSFLVSKYVNNETTVCKCERENKINNWLMFIYSKSEMRKERYHGCMLHLAFPNKHNVFLLQCLNNGLPSGLKVYFWLWKHLCYQV